MIRQTLTGCTLALATGLSVAGPAVADGPDRLMTILTSADPQTQLMAMVLTNAAIQQGKSAQILLCGPAGDIALREAPDSATAPQPPRDMSPQGLLRMIMDNSDTRVEVCAIYLPGRGEGPEVLLDGVTAATPAEAAAAIMGDATQVISF
jgi:hypothetical protein